MKVFFVEFFLNESLMNAVIAGESPGDVWMKILKRYKDHEGIIFLKNTKEVHGPFYYISRQEPFK